MDEDFPREQTPLVAPPAPIPPLDILSCFERSFALLRQHPGPLAVPALLGASFHLVGFLHPYAAYTYNLLLVGLVGASVNQIFLKRIRGETTSLRDLGLGLREQPLQLILATLACGAIQMTCSYPLQNYLLDPATVPVWLVALGIIGTLYFGLAYTFTFPLVLDRGLGFWEAMETSRRLVLSQPVRILGLLLLSFLVLALGAFSLLVGLLIAIPIVIGALAYAYEDLVRAAE